MAEVKYSQIDPIAAVLNEWWTVPGLPVPLMRAVVSIRRKLAENRETREELRKKLIEDYGAKDNDGNPVYIDIPVVDETGKPVLDGDGKPITDKSRQLTNDAAANAAWGEIAATIFECETINEAWLEPHAERLGLTPQKLEIIDGLIV